MFKYASVLIIYMLASFVMSYAIVSAAYQLAPEATIIAVVCYLLKSATGNIMGTIVEEKLKEKGEK